MVRVRPHGGPRPSDEGGRALYTGASIVSLANESGGEPPLSLPAGRRWPVPVSVSDWYVSASVHAPVSLAQWATVSASCLCLCHCQCHIAM